MPRHTEDDDEDAGEIYPGDAEEWQDYLESQNDRDDDFGSFLEGLDYLDDIFDYPEDTDWYSET